MQQKGNLGHSRSNHELSHGKSVTSIRPSSKRHQPQLRGSSSTPFNSDSLFSAEGSQSLTLRNFAKNNESRKSLAQNDGGRRSPVRSQSSRKNSGSQASESGSTSSQNHHIPINVTIRVRPALKKEAGMEDIVTCAHDGQTLLLESADRSKQVTVDVVIDSRRNQGSQQHFYDRVGRSLVASSLKDYNVCIFAYGHTGSGKTYTVLGHGGIDGPHVGLLPRFIRNLFEEHASLPSILDAHYSCQYYEVYNETIRDLLAPIHVQGQDRRREVRVHPKYGVRIEGLSTSVVKDAAGTLDLVLFGNQMRTVATTTMNAQSSRSHCLFTFRYESETDKEHHESVMTFVDLAGREDQIANQNKEVQLREMTYINTSLFHLSHLITKLSDGSIRRSTLADFRNSKLTLLLYQALVGNSCTVLLATIAPAKVYFEDSLSTLNFAQQVKKIKTRPVINTKKASAVVQELENEIVILRNELTIAKTSNSEIEQNLIAAQALISHYTSGREHDRASSADACLMRRRLSTVLGLQNSDAGCHMPKLPSGETLPFLTKLSDDSSLQGCCNYFLMKERTRIGGLQERCDIVVQGVGIRPSMCIIVVNADKSIMVELCQNVLNSKELDCDGIPERDHSMYDARDEPRVLINGVYLTANDGFRVLEHGDAIILGYSHAFRLVVPSCHDVAPDAYSMVFQKLQKLDLTSAMEEVKEEGSRRFQQIYSCLPHMHAESSETTAQALLQVLNVVCPLIDEANAITREVLGIGTLKFELSSLSNCPQVVICVFADADYQVNHKSRNGNARTRRMSCSLVPTVRTPMVASLGLPSPMALSEDLLLYVWTLEKFMRRLSEMREVYQVGVVAHDGFAAVREQLQGDPFVNPWREATFVDVKLLSENARYSLNFASTSNSEPKTTPQAACRHASERVCPAPPDAPRLDGDHSSLQASGNEDDAGHCLAETSAASIFESYVSNNLIEGNSLTSSSSPENCFRSFLDVRKRLMELEAYARCPADTTQEFSTMLEKLEGMFDRIASPPTFRKFAPKKHIDELSQTLSEAKAAAGEKNPVTKLCQPVLVSSTLRESAAVQRFQRKTLELLGQG